MKASYEPLPAAPVPTPMPVGRVVDPPRDDFVSAPGHHLAEIAIARERARRGSRANGVLLGAVGPLAALPVDDGDQLLLARREREAVEQIAERVAVGVPDLLEVQQVAVRDRGRLVERRRGVPVNGRPRVETGPARRVHHHVPPRRRRRRGRRLRRRGGRQGRRLPGGGQRPPDLRRRPGVVEQADVRLLPEGGGPVDQHGHPAALGDRDDGHALEPPRVAPVRLDPLHLDPVDASEIETDRVRLGHLEVPRRVRLEHHLGDGRVGLAREGAADVVGALLGDELQPPAVVGGEEDAHDPPGPRAPVLRTTSHPRASAFRSPGSPVPPSVNCGSAPGGREVCHSTSSIVIARMSGSVVRTTV